MPQLDSTWFASQLFWLAVTFVGLYFVLSRFVLPPLQEIVARRQSTVEEDIAQAGSFNSQAEHARNDYERTLADARGRAQFLMNEAMESYKAKSEAALKEMERLVEVKLADATRRIMAKKEEMIHAVAPTMNELTALIFQKLTQQLPNNEQVHSILDELQKGRR